MKIKKSNVRAGQTVPTPPVLSISCVSTYIGGI